MSELSQQPVFLKALHQPFLLKELPWGGGDEPPIDVGHLARTSRGERDLELQVLELFDRQAEMLVSCMPEVDRAGVASAAHTLAGSAREIGAWRGADAAAALERAGAENRELASALQTLDCTGVEARLAICAMLRTRLSTVRTRSCAPAAQRIYEWARLIPLRP